jgi:cation diffusion facilitator family transporter
MVDRRLKVPVILSVVAAVATLALKYFAYHLTGSVGLLSDAAESVVNVLAAVTALVSLHVAARPVDINHTYGHEKIEYFSSGLEGLLMFAAAGAIIWYAAHRFFDPSPLQALDLGLAVSLGASLINLVVARILLRVGREHRSIILEADGKHLMSDVYSSAAVFIAMGVVRLTGREVLDPLIAILMSLYIMWAAGDLLWRSFNGLMDHALSDDEQEKMRVIIEANLEPQMDYHALRTRQAGSRRFADFHLLVPGEQSVAQAHAVGSRIEDAIRQALPGIEVQVHIEPIEERESYTDSELLPIERAARQERARQERSPGGEAPH